MGWWSASLLPRMLDRSLSSPTFAPMRREVCAGLHGEVLEIGFGSGLNLPHLPDTVTRVVAVEPSDVAWGISRERVEAREFPVVRGSLDAAQLDVPTGSIDSAVSVLTLCVVPDVERAVGELVRALRPGGTFHFLEHGLAPDPDVAAWQRRIEPFERRFAGGCHLSRSAADLIDAGGLVIDEVEHFYLPGPTALRPWGYLTRGVAHRP
ncbi:MAG: class I SAM-dependent methyltransferase [Georgenia sp.]